MSNKNNPELVSFYEIEFIISFGLSKQEVVIGTKRQAEQYAIEKTEGTSNKYKVNYLAANTFDGIENLCNTNVQD